MPSLSCRGTRHLFSFVMPRNEVISLLCHAEVRAIFLSCRGTGISSSLSCRAFFVMLRHEASFSLSCRERGISSLPFMPGNEASLLLVMPRCRQPSLSCRGTRGHPFFVMPRHGHLSLVMPATALSCRGIEASLLPCHAGVRGISLVIPVQRPCKYPSDGSSHPVATSQISPIQNSRPGIKRLYQIQALSLLSLLFLLLQ